MLDTLELDIREIVVQVPVVASPYDDVAESTPYRLVSADDAEIEHPWAIYGRGFDVKSPPPQIGSCIRPFLRVGI